MVSVSPGGSPLAVPSVSGGAPASAPANGRVQAAAATAIASAAADGKQAASDSGRIHQIEIRYFKSAAGLEFQNGHRVMLQNEIFVVPLAMGSFASRFFKMILSEMRPKYDLPDLMKFGGYLIEFMHEFDFELYSNSKLYIEDKLYSDTRYKQMPKPVQAIIRKALGDAYDNFLCKRSYTLDLIWYCFRCVVSAKN